MLKRAQSCLKTGGKSKFLIEKEMLGKISLISLEILLVADITILIGYRHIVRSSYLFVTAGTVFYPLVVLNIIAALVVLAAIIRSFVG
jgi:hypothetical protein